MKTSLIHSDPLFQIIYLSRGKKFYRIITIVLLHNWNKLCVNVTKWRKMMSRFTKSCVISSKKKENVKVYYKKIFKLTNCLQIKAANIYLTIIFLTFYF